MVPVRDVTKVYNLLLLHRANLAHFQLVDYSVSFFFFFARSVAL